jgi:hypothetical protein
VIFVLFLPWEESMDDCLSLVNTLVFHALTDLRGCYPTDRIFDDLLNVGVVQRLAEFVTGMELEDLSEAAR